MEGNGNGKVSPSWQKLQLKAEQDFVRALCACLTLGRLKYVAEIAAWFHPKFIQDKKCYQIARVLLNLAKSGEPCTPYSIAKALLRTKKRAGTTLEELADLVTNQYEFCHVRYYACEVYDAYRRRQAIQESHVSLSKLGQGEELQPVIEELSTLGTRLGPAPQNRVIDNESTFQKIIKEMEMGKERSFSLGLVDIDRMNGGCEPSDFIVVGARTSCGKSVFLGQAAIMAAGDEQRVLFFSLEMSRDQMLRRWACWCAQVSMPPERSSFNRKEWLDGLAEVEMLTRNGYLEMFAGTKTISQIEREARAYAKTIPVDIICVDYLQKIKSNIKTDRRHEQVADNAQRLKNLAMELDVSVICASQLNRAATDKPSLSHLRESGDIEQEANAVILIHPINVNQDATETHFICAKTRNGPTGLVKAIWNKPRFRFYDFAKDRPGESGPKQQEFL